MVSYTHQARLKMYAIAKVVEPEENSGLFSSIDPADYKHKPERMIVLDVQAYDWNCRQHITPRYTSEEVEIAFSSQRKYILDLQEQNKLLIAELAALKTKL